MVIAKRENWNGRYVWVVRDNKGKILSWTRAKGSNLNSQTAKEKFKEDNTLQKGKIRVRTTTITKTKDQRVTDISARTSIVIQEKPIGRSFQMSAFVNWESSGETQGYSTITSNREQGQREAFNMAFAEAIRQGIFSYDWTVNNYAGRGGFVQSPNGDKTIFFSTSFKTFNYVKV